MRFKITTNINRSSKEVFENFGLDLFSKLSPLGVKLKVIQFDGCKKGDIVKIELNMLGLFKQQWTSYVTAAEESATEYWFIDEAKTRKDLPFFLGGWKHLHRIVSTGEKSCQIVVV